MTESPVRWPDPDSDPEFRCSMCDHWWPLTVDFWRPGNGMKRCRACWKEYHRIHEAARTKDEAIREVKRFKNRLRYLENRERNLAANKRWKAENRERVAAYNRAYRERRKAA